MRTDSTSCSSSNAAARVGVPGARCSAISMSGKSGKCSCPSSTRHSGGTMLWATMVSARPPETAILPPAKLWLVKAMRQGMPCASRALMACSRKTQPSGNNASGKGVISCAWCCRAPVQTRRSARNMVPRRRFGWRVMMATSNAPASTRFNKSPLRAPMTSSCTRG